MKTFILALMMTLVALTASAQPVSVDKLTPAFPTQTERNIADAASYATVIIPLALDAYSAWKGDEPMRDLGLFGARVLTVYVSASIAKGIAKRTRPCAPSCGVDNPNASFFSMHTAFPFSTLGGPRLAISIPFSVGTGGLRIAAGKHWLTDTAFGALDGALVSRIRRKH